MIKIINSMLIDEIKGEHMDTLNFEHVNYDTLSDIKPILTNFVYADLHWHKEIEIIFVCQDEAEINVQGEKLTLKQGDIYVVNSELLHSINSLRKNNNGIVLLLQMGERFIRSLHINIEAVRYSQLSNHSQTTGEVRDYLLRIISEIKSRKPSYELVIQGYCSNIIAILMRYHTIQEDEATKMQRISDKTNLLRLKRIFTYVHEHYHENPSLSDIAALEHVSLYHLSHIFKKAVGMNYSQYLNSIRVDMVRRDLSETNESITDIFLRHGFHNFKTFNRTFKKIVGCSPTEYRRSTANVVNLGKFDSHEADSSFGNYIYLKDSIEIPDSLFRKHDESDVLISRDKQEVFVKIEAIDQTTKLDRYYRVMTAAARASDLLRADVREHFRTAQRELGFQYVRFHGLFNDEMCVLDPRGDGKHYNFTYIDLVFDFLLEIGLRPFVEFSFMPTAIASGQETIFFYEANISPPKDIQLWQNLISAFMRHIISRYSKEEVRKWYFEVWNEPNLPASWSGSFGDYMELYKVTALAVKSIDPQFRVGGPSLNSFQYNNAKFYLEKFLGGCSKEKLPVDFVSGHPYPAFYYNIDGEWTEELCGPEQTKEDMQWIRDTVCSSDYPNAEIHLGEWNSSSIDRDLMHDTAFMAVFILNNIVKCMNLAHSLTFWALTDIFEENYISIHEFHGGFGMLNRNGLKKPAYFAFLYLNRLSDFIISRGSNYIITKNDISTQILAWNYCHYKKQYATGDRSNISFYQRYDAFDVSEPMHFRFQVPFANGDYFVEKVKFDRENGSVFDIWLKNGALEYMTPNQLELIKEQNHPSRSLNVYKCQDEIIELTAEIKPFGFSFFEIRPAPL